MLNKIVAHYKILEKLGSGGMGIVYKARDLKLHRYVALKFLSPHLSADEITRQRFLQEARAISALDHPNICTVHSLDRTEDGHLFICMAYYKGETLKQRLSRGPLPFREAVRLALQIGQALRCGHEAGIVHRDVKPANVILTDRGEVKLVDFGLAKLADSAIHTRTGIAIGTPGYMAPEQIKGKGVDHRADIWALGVVLYEMLSGRLPFRGSDYAEISHSVLTDPPQPLTGLESSIERRINAILEKALEKDPAQRYQSIEEMLRELESFGLAPGSAGQMGLNGTVEAETQPSIAVLPFTDMSPEHDQEYLCDGLTEELINALTHVRELRVASRTSAFQFKGREIDVREIGRKLNVRTVLEGSIRTAGQKIRVATKLIDVTNGFYLWAEQYERELRDVFAIQDEIARQVVRTLKEKFGLKHGSSIRIHRPNNFKVYSIYLKGRYYWNKRTVEELKKGARYFKQAIELDATYPLTYAGLADAYNTLGIYGAYPPARVIPRAIQAASRALELEEHLPEAHISLGCSRSIYEWDWEKAEQAFQTGLELNDRYAIGHHWYAINFLTPLLRFDEAIREVHRALELDPISLVVNTTVGIQYYFAQDYNRAIKQLQETLELDAHFGVAHFFLGKALLQKRRYDEALNSLKRALKLCGESTNMLATYGSAAALAGRDDIALRVLDKLMKASQEKYVSAYDIATICACMGYEEQALEWLERAVQERAYLLIYSRVDPLLENIRRHPRFQAVVKKLNWGG